jgi:hypothetical protein
MKKISSSRMDERHAHLDAMLEPEYRRGMPIAARRLVRHGLGLQFLKCFRRPELGCFRFQLV